MSDTLADLSAHELAARIRKREISAEEALNAALERSAQVDGRAGELDYNNLTKDDQSKVHAFITHTEDRARQQAQRVDQALDKGEVPGPLAGVPFTAKDIFTVKDTLSTAGSRILRNFTAPYTATSVARVEAAGGVLLGKVNLDEFAYGSSSESSAYKPHPRNPWDTGKVTGGSSGGSAAAVATGQGALSIGTDTGGSIRQPAAFCGVVGLKPTYGRVSRYGLIAFGSSLDCPGPLARNITDAALMMNVIAGPDPRDNTTASIPVPDYTAGIDDGIKGMRIGISPDFLKIVFFNTETGELEEHPIAAEIKTAVEQAADVLSAAGARIIENVAMPHTKYGIPTYFVISRVEAASNLHRFDGVKYGHRTESATADLLEMYRQTRGEGFGGEPKLRILMGMYVSAAQFSAQYYQRALKVRSLIRADYDAAFDPAGEYKLDALLTPTTPTPPFPIGDVYGDTVLMQYADQFTVTANHAGVPAMSFPGGLSAENTPIGLQLIGPDYAEAGLFRIGRAFEMETAAAPWRAKRPAVLEA
jgi:aspartyl-tRNA(Asn)/glutamyl-tRNA(Gln) amidotransferase subunit A